MDPIYRSSMNEVSSIDDKIKAYIKEILPLLLPSNADWEEQYKLEKILFNAAALNVYSRSIDKLQEDFKYIAQNSGHNLNRFNYSFDKDIEAAKVWHALELTNPNFPSNGIVLKKPTNSRYMSYSTWKEKYKYEGQENKRRLVREYTRRTWQKMSTEQYFKKENCLPETYAAFVMRDFFNNSGNLNLVNFDSEEYKDLLESVEGLRKELLEKTYNINSLNARGVLPDSYTFSPDAMLEKDYLFRTGCENLRCFTGMCMAMAHANNIAIDLQKKEDRKLDKKEFLKLSKVVIDIFDKEFSHLPTNEAQHEQIMNDLYKKVSQYLATMPGARLNNPYEYKKLMDGLYKKYMKQLEHGTLPIRLSYLPEDKALYEEILRQTQNAQSLERVYGNEFDNIPAAMIGGVGIVFAALAGMISAADGNFVLPAAELTAGISCYILHKINTNRRLNMDVAERYKIKHLKIKSARKQYAYEEPQKYYSTTKEDASTRKRRTERNQALYKKLEYTELTDDEMNIFTADNNADSSKAPSTRERHRRADRYKEKDEI